MAAGRLSNMRWNGKGPRPNRSAQRRGPLKKIVNVLHFSTGLFDTNMVELECGHTTDSNGVYRARCAQCRIVAASQEGTK